MKNETNSPFITSGTSLPSNVPSYLNEFGTLTPNPNADNQSHQEDRSQGKSQEAKKSVPKTSEEMSYRRPRFVTVKDLARFYGITLSAIYNFIKTEPDFPYVNTGIKKKFLVDVARFEMWINERTNKQKREHFAIPSSLDLLTVFKSKNFGGKK